MIPEPDRRQTERRVRDVPWKRPRWTDMRTGERTYKERRVNQRRDIMRFRIHIAGEHSEGHVSAAEIQQIVRQAERALLRRGFRADVLDYTHNDTRPPEETFTSAANVPIVPPDAENSEDSLSPEATEETFEEQVARRYAELGSQAKVADELGVSRYAVKKALG